jgi:dTDP-4-amino-4,6-dideoxy-D-galactose acyltransferase
MTVEQAAEILAWCGRQSIDCLYFLSDTDPVSTVVAENHGFHLTDMRLELEARIPSEPGDGGPGYRVRPATCEDVPALRAIAGASHTESRFYRDGHFPSALCDELYRVWIEKSCAGGADMVFVAEHEAQPAGYITCEVKRDRGKIGLIAVAPAAQGSGLGHALVESALGWMRARGVTSASVVTQGGNVRAQRLYQKHGFVSHSIKLWYHLWVPKEIR